MKLMLRYTSRGKLLNYSSKKRFVFLLRTSAKTEKKSKKCIKNMQLVTARPLFLGRQCPTGLNGG